MIEVRAPIFSRREALAITRDALRDLINKIRAGNDDPISVEVFTFWSARLEAASRLCPDFQLSEAASSAIDSLAHAFHDVEDHEALVDWLDLLPRNALALVQVTPVVLATLRSTARVGDLGNERKPSLWGKTAAALPRTSAA